MLLDIQLPGMDGLEVLSRAKEIDEELVVIMVTALGVLETAVKAMRLGAYDYINKPFNLDELAIIIRKAMEIITSYSIHYTKLYEFLGAWAGFEEASFEPNDVEHILPHFVL